MRCSTSDSGIPATRSSRAKRRTPVAKRARRGSTSRFEHGFQFMRRAGKQNHDAASASSHRPGAVPRGFAGRRAFGNHGLALVHFGHRAAELAEAFLNARRIRRCDASLRPSRSATASRVRSSSVGPRPPQATISSTVHRVRERRAHFVAARRRPRFCASLDAQLVQLAR